MRPRSRPYDGTSGPPSGGRSPRRSRSPTSTADRAYWCLGRPPTEPPGGSRRGRVPAGRRGGDGPTAGARYRPPPELIRGPGSRSRTRGVSAIHRPASRPAPQRARTASTPRTSRALRRCAAPTTPSPRSPSSSAGPPPPASSSRPPPGGGRAGPRHRTGPAAGIRAGRRRTAGRGGVGERGHRRPRRPARPARPGRRDDRRRRRPGRYGPAAVAAGQVRRAPQGRSLKKRPQGTGSRSILEERGLRRVPGPSRSG